MSRRSTSSTCSTRLVGSSAIGSGSDPPSADEVGSRGSQLSSIEMSSPSQMIDQRSMTFCSSRTFPGHEYASSTRIVSASTPRGARCRTPAWRRRKRSTSSGMSSLRSRSLPAVGSIHAASDLVHYT
jgi:hypothetical protein